jgi:predicted RNase H-like HicB family nuclease
LRIFHWLLRSRRTEHPWKEFNAKTQRREDASKNELTTDFTDGADGNPTAEEFDNVWALGDTADWKSALQFCRSAPIGSSVKMRRGSVSLCPEMDVASQGGTFDEALANLKEALEGFFETASAEEVQRRLMKPTSGQQSKG